MNQQFYIAVNGQQTGPFSLEDLRTKNIQRDTLIWTEGLDSWTKAEHVALLKDILRAIPPPLPNIESKPTSQQIPPPPIVTSQLIGKYFGYELAQLPERLFARLAEAVIIGTPVVMIFGGEYFGTHDFGDKIILGFLSGLIIAVISLFIYPLWSGNLGHKIFGLKVISAKDGSDYNNSWRGAFREFLKHLFGPFFIPNLWLIWDSDSQNLYDKVVHTYVVKKKPVR